MADMIGYSTKIKDALNMIDEDDVSPVLTYKNALYVLETAGREFGNLYYTKFTNASTPQYSITIPYSFADTVAQLLNKGDSLRPKLKPRIDILPPLGLAHIYRHVKPDDLLNTKKPAKSIIPKD